MDGINVIFWGGIFAALTAASTLVVAMYYLTRALITTIRRRATRSMNQDSRRPS